VARGYLPSRRNAPTGMRNRIEAPCALNWCLDVPVRTPSTWPEYRLGESAEARRTIRTTDAPERRPWLSPNKLVHVKTAERNFPPRASHSRRTWTSRQIGRSQYEHSSAPMAMSRPHERQSGKGPHQRRARCYRIPMNKMPIIFRWLAAPTEKIALTERSPSAPEART